MFREFKVGELFTLTGLKQVKSQKNVVESDDGVPFVIQSTKNNMVKCHVDRQALLDGGENVYDGNAIVLGVTLPAVSYQELEFGASQVITARRDDLNPVRGLYLVTAMRKALLPKYSYTNKPGIQKYKEDVIHLPVKPGTDEVDYTEDDIDWRYMESYIHELEESYIHELEESYIHELDAYLKETGLDDYTLTDDEREVLEREPVFKEFEVGELFETYTVSKKLTKAALSLNGTVPVYSSDTRNNGVLGYTEQVPTFIVNAVQPTYVIFGDHTRTINIVHESFCVMDNVKVLSPKFDLSDETLLYIKTVWLKGIPVLGYARHWSVAKDVALFLPVKQGTDDVDYTEADIDWVYMDAYVRVMEKLVIADVVDYKNEMIATTKGLIKN